MKRTSTTTFLSIAVLGGTLGGAAWGQAASSLAATSSAAETGAVSAAASAAEPASTPSTPIRHDADSSVATVDPASLLPDLPPVPSVKATEIGGTISKLDRARDRMTVNVFGGGHMMVLFDPRTRVVVGSAEESSDALREGARVHFDTILDHGTVFARTIRVSAGEAQGETQGIVMDYRADRGELSMRDAMSPAPVRVRLTASTRITNGDHAVAADNLSAGSLVSVKFYNQAGSGNFAREVSVLALPGAPYTFTGQLVSLNLSTGLLVLESATDGKTYEIFMDTSSDTNELRPGANVAVVATFEQSRYVARTLNVLVPQAK